MMEGSAAFCRRHINVLTHPVLSSLPTQLLPQPWVESESWIKRKDLVQQITQEVEVSPFGLFQSN